MSAQRNHQQGSFIQTNGALDLAINGSGYFLAQGKMEQFHIPEMGRYQLIMKVI